MSRDPVIWVGAIATIAIFSILYRENRLYRFFEHLFIGLSAGFIIARTWTDNLAGNWWGPLWEDGKWWMMFPVLLGAMYYFIYVPKYSWVTRMIIGFFFGFFGGSALKGFVTGYSPHILASFKPILEYRNRPGTPIDWYVSFSNWIFLVALLSTMSYFFFSIEHKRKVAAAPAQAGRWFIMIYLGAIFGTTVMGRMSLLIARLFYLFQDWIHLLKA